MLAVSEEDAPLRALGPFLGRSIWERWGEVDAEAQYRRVLRLIEALADVDRSAPVDTCSIALDIEHSAG